MPGNIEESEEPEGNEENNGRKNLIKIQHLL
jgi:hypothetical protein